MQCLEVKDKFLFFGVILVNGDYVVICLNGVSELEEVIFDDEKVMYCCFLVLCSGQVDFVVFCCQLQDKVEVEKY